MDCARACTHTRGSIISHLVREIVLREQAEQRRARSRLQPSPFAYVGVAALPLHRLEQLLFLEEAPPAAKEHVRPAARQLQRDRPLEAAATRVRREGGGRRVRHRGGHRHARRHTRRRSRLHERRARPLEMVNRHKQVVGLAAAAPRRRAGGRVGDEVVG